MQQVSARETAILLELARECLACAGDVVELGCYRGDTSLLLERLLETEAPEKRLFIYDSFAGLPERSAADGTGAGAEFRPGELVVSKREVVERFKKAGLKVPRVKKGWFEELGPADLPEEICFAFCDGDLYSSIRASLALVAPRMSVGGMIIVHDYNRAELPGVTQAVEEFVQGRPNLRLTQRESFAMIKL